MANMTSDRDMKRADDAAKAATKQAEKMGEAISRIARGYTQPLQLLIDKFNALGGQGKLLAGVFTAVGVAISSATEASKRFYNSLNSIKGINGNVGELAKAITTAATGSVTRQDIADFLSATSELFSNTTAIQQNTSFINNLIGLYGDVNTAVNKFNSVLMLSTQDQAKFAEYAEKANKIIQQSPTAQLQATTNALKELVVTLGSDLLYVLKPVITLISGIAEAIRKLNGETGSHGLSEAEVYQQLNELAKQYGMTLEELNQIEKGSFLSSLDEVTSTGQGVLEGVFGESTEQTTELNTELEKTPTIIQSIIDVVATLWSSLQEVFELIGQPFLEIIGWVTELIARFLDWADSVGILTPIVGGLVAAFVALKAVQLAQAIAGIITQFVAMVAPTQAATTALWSNAAAGIAAAGSSTFGIAVPVIVGAITAGLIALGLSGFTSGGGYSGSGASATTNQYDGVGQDMRDNAQVSVYMDGDLVNDALARSRSNSGGSPVVEVK